MSVICNLDDLPLISRFEKGATSAQTGLEDVVGRMSLPLSLIAPFDVQKGPYD
jgi:hydroxymethylglutaryl-CoA reductase